MNSELKEVTQSKVHRRELLLKQAIIASSWI